MGLFSSLKKAILSKISHRDRGGGQSRPAPPAAGPSADAAGEEVTADSKVSFPPVTAPATVPREPSRLSATELASQLDALAAKNPEKLEWRTSIVDLMKLVGMDSSLAERKEMALELGYSQDDIDSKGSADMNLWLQKRVMEKLSKDTDGDLTVA